MEAPVVARFTELLASVTSSLSRQPARVIAIVPGTQVVWDSCEDGQLTGRLVSMEPVYGGGGGGGGAAVNGNLPGKGGDGGPGVVVVITHFA